MYYIFSIIFTIISLFYCNKKLRSIKLRDFMEEDSKLNKVDNTCTEMNVNNKINSDNNLMMIISVLLITVFINIKTNLFFIPVIPILVSIFFIDIRMKQIPNDLNLVIFLLSILNLFFNLSFNNIINTVLLFIIYFIIAIITGGALGGGDIKLIGAIGLFFNLATFPKFLVYPFLIGALQAIYLVIFKHKKKDEMFAFAPSIIISVIIISLFNIL